jgi:hypothetical protein
MFRAEKKREKGFFIFIPILILLMVLPLIGILIAGKTINDFLEFPSTTQYVTHAGFSLPIFIVMAVSILLCALAFRIYIWIKVTGSSDRPKVKQPLPWWGWFSLFCGLGSWVLAWTRFPWFEPLQLYTFTPLWLSYIFFINALTFKRTGRCLLVDRPKTFSILFPVSAIFWWYFEYLNRFVQNWYYIEAENYTKLEYFLLATISFSIVLPAVLSTYQFLRSIPRIGGKLKQSRIIRLKSPRFFSMTILILLSLGLAGIGVFPDLLFPLLWLSPLIIISTIQTIGGQETIFSSLKSGDWSRLYLMGLAALMCGFFWEMWNFYSLAKWAYEVPFVSALKIFEMPILGYTGYLPFGLECAVISDLVTGSQKTL